MAKILETDLSIETAQTWDDDALVMHARQDPYAYAQLYDRYLEQVYGYFLLRLGSAVKPEFVRNPPLFRIYR